MLNARVAKPSTRAGFRPHLHRTGPLHQRAMRAFRRDARLDTNAINARLRQSTFERARLTNIVSSYAIEGIKVPRDEAARAIDAGEGGDPRQRSVRAFGEAYARFHERRLPRLSAAMIRELHGTLFDPDDLDHGAPGRFKTEPNGVYDADKGEFVFQATAPEDTEAELDQLVAWMETEAPSYPPPLAAAVFFAELEAIHPFADGNGRLGRLLNLYALKHLGQENAFLLPLDAQFLKRHKAYYAALETTNAGKDYSTWIAFYLACLEDAQDEAESLGRLLDDVGRTLRPSERHLLEWALSAAPTGWFQRADYPNPHALSSAALTNALARLVELGVLDFEGEKRGRRYRVRKDAVETLAGGDKDHP